MRLLFFKHSLVWPRSSGHDVNTYYMMQACALLGHDVSLATASQPSARAIEDLPLCTQVALDAEPHLNGETVPATWLQRRFRGFYGIPPARITALAHAVAAARAEAVIVVGLDALPYLTGLTGVLRVWYAADEWVWHHLSLLREVGALRANVRDAVIKGVYERAHAGLVDRAWVVSEGEARAMQWFAGMPAVDVLPSGVDIDFYRPGGEHAAPRTAVFWGRLDFAPNVQALQWFCKRVWPRVRQRAGDARLTIIGFHPGDAVRRLEATPGVTVMADLADLRSTVRQHAVVVLPFVSGGGIKNKLLEAAALGRPILCTPVAAGGLRHAKTAPMVQARSAEAFGDALLALWNNPDHCAILGQSAREWVTTHHTWAATAKEATDALQDALAQRAGA